MCYKQRKTEGGVGALQESDDTNFLKPTGQSKNFNGLWFMVYFQLLWFTLTDQLIFVGW